MATNRPPTVIDGGRLPQGQVCFNVNVNSRGAFNGAAPGSTNHRTASVAAVRTMTA